MERRRKSDLNGRTSHTIERGDESMWNDQPPLARPMARWKLGVLRHALEGRPRAAVTGNCLCPPRLRRR
jgi:hypothetical protein